MRRDFVTLTDGQRQVHYRYAGSGPPLVALHATPDSSRAMASLGDDMAARGWTVLALDTPGYGESDPLATTNPSMHHYVDALRNTLDALGLDRVDLLGLGSGATLAAAFAAGHSRRVLSLSLHSPLTCSPHDRDAFLASYSPKLAPEWDGSHLLRAWMIRRDMHLFQPWFERTSAARLRATLPSPAELHQECLDLLRARDDWGAADQAAFRFDLEAALASVEAPIANGLSEPTADRVDLLALRRPPTQTRRSGFARQYVDVSFGQVHVRRIGSASGRPLLMLHASPSSSRTVLPLAERLASSRPVIAMDTPGFGESDPLSQSDPSVTDYASAVLEVVDALGKQPLDLYGSHTGASIALEAAVRGPDRVRRVVFDGLPVFSPDEGADHFNNYIPLFEPHGDGSHLVWAWNFIRDMVLFYPWYRQDASHSTGRAPTTAMLHERVIDLLKAGPGYALGYRAVYRYQTPELVRRLTAPALLCVAHDDVLAHHAQRAAAAQPDLSVTWLAPTDRLGRTTSAIEAFLGPA
jgi:pimeloyl-ACP methyl ester carboxylesterase